MKIQISPKFVECQECWGSKGFGCIFVQKEEDIDIVWNVLCDQDEYWDDYKNLIKVAPVIIESEKDLYKYCNYVGKTDVYDVNAVKRTLFEKGIEIVFYQTNE